MSEEAVSQVLYPCTGCCSTCRHDQVATADADTWTVRWVVQRGQYDAKSCTRDTALWVLVRRREVGIQITRRTGGSVVVCMCDMACSMDI